MAKRKIFATHVTTPFGERVYVSGKTKEEFEKKLASSSKYVLSMQNGKSLTKRSFRKMWDIVEARTVGKGKCLGDKVIGSSDPNARVCLDFSCTPHLLRHTYITMLFEDGMDVKQVQYLAGHATPDMTLRVYTHYRRKSREAETAQIVDRAIQHLG
ncbi:MAG: hypothetical protein E7457_00490 [Ruminococcaceae bacterium]|nr:hypothetical protein [Oscillospiraceae bacterium]